MSANIYKNKAFITLLLDGDKTQAVSLLKSISPEQVLVLREIAQNIDNYLDLYPILKSVLDKNKKVLKSLKNQRKNNRLYIKRHSKLILSFLYKIHPVLRQLLK